MPVAAGRHDQAFRLHFASNRFEHFPLALNSDQLHHQSMMNLIQTIQSNTLLCVS